MRAVIANRDVVLLARIVRSAGAVFGTALALALLLIVGDAWSSNTMGEYYDPTDVWGTMKWGYAARLVLVMTAAFSAAGLGLVAVGGVIRWLYGVDGRRSE